MLMTVRRVARFHPQRGQAGGGRSSGKAKLALRFLDAVSLCLIVMMVAAPWMWGKKRAGEAVDRWSQPRLNDLDRVETDWLTCPLPPEFTQGNEPFVSTFLGRQPLVLALWDRSSGTLWMRRGDGLERDAARRGEPAVLAGWFRDAEASRSFLYFPQGGLADEARPVPKVILRGDRWLVAKRWKEGSPEVERSLHNLLGSAPGFRVALVKEGDEARKNLKPEPWGEEPNLQASPYAVQKSIFSTQVLSNEFSGWTFTAIPYRAQARAMQLRWRMLALLAGLGSLGAGGALALGMHLRAKARRKEALDADRMASMTHSLKTPLAILKSRCDTLRLRPYSQDELDAQLIQIGEEADRMADMIGQALQVIQGPPEAGVQGEASPAWFQDLGEDLAPAFAAGNRDLSLRLAEESGRANLPGLRAALFTLLENALFHGRGAVTLETLRTRKRFVIKVSDEGPGLGPVELRELGQPFLRLRQEGREGFAREGRGLGLSLLCKVVEREGWGLSFASEPGRGLSATLEIGNA
jgi:signal transduction histidine kinase